jgi:hypothetical protein
LLPLKSSWRCRSLHRANSLKFDPSKENSPKPSLIKVIIPMTLLAVVIALSGCGPSISATVSVYHTLPDSKAPTRYAFVTLKDQDENSENASYKNVIRQELIKHRYLESDMPNASLLLSFSYGINEGREAESQGIFRTSSYTEYRRGLWLFIFQKAAAGEEEKKVVYEGSVIAVGTLTQVSTAMPQMIKELFREFPGESGMKRKEFIEP